MNKQINGLKKKMAKTVKSDKLAKIDMTVKLMTEPYQIGQVEAEIVHPSSPEQARFLIMRVELK